MSKSNLSSRYTVFFINSFDFTKLKLTFVPITKTSTMRLCPFLHLSFLTLVLLLTSCSPEYNEFGQQQGKLKVLNTSLKFTPDNLIETSEGTLTRVECTLEDNILHTIIGGIVAPQNTWGVSVKSKMKNQTLFISVDFRGTGHLYCGLIHYYDVTCDIMPIQKQDLTIVIEVQERQLQLQANFYRQDTISAHFHCF